MANNANNANANERASKIETLAHELQNQTEILRNAKHANYYFEIYAQTGAKSLVLRKGAQNALKQMFDFEPLPRVSNKNIRAFELYERACDFCDGCIRGADILK